MLQRNMGDSSGCLMQPFCYASGIENEANESNPIHALGQSVSFGRFMSESYAWDDKWSNFSNKRYVEEAERFSRPGSVAQKKAFFEAHYKKLAAQKAAAAALLEQANNATKNEQKHEAVVDNNIHDSHMTSPKTDENAKIVKSQLDATLGSTYYNSNSCIETSLSQNNKEEVAQKEMKHQSYEGNSMLADLHNQIQDVDDHKELSGKVSEIPPMDSPKLKQGSYTMEEVLQSTGKKKPPLSPFKLLKVIAIGTFKYTTSTPVKSRAPSFSNEDNVGTTMSNNPALSSADTKRLTPKKSLHMSFDFKPIREITRLTTKKFESSRIGAGSSKASKDSMTPLRAPSMTSEHELQKHSSLNSSTENKRNKMVSPIISSPFNLRTEERAASRKKKHEENFNGNEAQNVQLHTTLKDKAKKNIGKLRHRFCFKARPLSDFYNETETSKGETNKDKLTHTESSQQRRRFIPSVVKSKTFLTLKRSSLNNDGIKNFEGKNDGTLTLPFTSNASMITSHENTSPNIQDEDQNERDH